MPGNRLGPRERYTYTDDSGENYAYETDVDLATAVGAVPAGSGLPTLPRRFRPRAVYVQNSTGTPARKRLIVPTNDNTLYLAVSSTSVTIDGEVFRSTGRVGERYSYGFTAPAPP